MKVISMNIADAELEIVKEWHVWRKQLPAEGVPTGTDGLVFYGHLTTARPDLLSFRCSGDKWQRVHGWLLHRRCVSD